MNLALVPAAGRSSRLGRPKPLVPIAGRPLIDHLLATLRRGGIDEVVVVVAAGEDGLLAHCEARKIPATINEQVALGMLSSIRRGLRFAESKLHRASTLTLCPVDFPWLESETVTRLIGAVVDSRHSIVVPEHAGRRGHPLVLSPEIVPEIERLDLDVGLRGLLDLRGFEPVPVADPGVLRDFDSWVDYASPAAGHSP